MPDLPEELAAVLRARAADAPAPPGPDDAVVRRVRRRAGLRAGAATSGVAVAVVAVVAAGAAVSNGTAGDDAVAGADCGPVTDHPYDGSVDHRVDGTLPVAIEYDRTPPNAGPHHPTPVKAPARRYGVHGAPPVERVVHNLEHGWVVVWYDAERADTTRLEAALLSADFPKMFAVPWTRGGLPAPYVVTAWGHEQRCAEVDGATLDAFAAEHGGENGDAPEPRAP